MASGGGKGGGSYMSVHVGFRLIFSTVNMLFIQGGTASSSQGRFVRLCRESSELEKERGKECINEWAARAGHCAVKRPHVTCLQQDMCKNWEHSGTSVPVLSIQVHDQWAILGIF